jgi:hypothetical protein
MKHKIFFILLFVLMGFLISSCDSSSNSVATPTATAPTLLAPPDNATGISLTPTFKWNLPAHKIQIDETSNFSSPVYDYSGLNGVKEYTLPPQILMSQKSYFWRVGVVSGSTVTWSVSAFRFATQ